MWRASRAISEAAPEAEDVEKEEEEVGADMEKELEDTEEEEEEVARYSTIFAKSAFYTTDG